MSVDTSIFYDQNTVFGKLKSACKDDWHAYCHHEFVQRVGDGTLPMECFQHYLQQDYLFLLHYARAYALAVYKSDNPDDMRAAVDSVAGVLAETKVHLSYCKEWSLTEQDVIQVPEARANMAYTRYVLERGMAGDILDLQVALSVCSVGYAEIGDRLINDPATKREGNPYWDWIQSYGGDEYLAGSVKTIETIERLAESRFTEKRLVSLQKTFQEATRLEIGFWDMGINCSF
ncbi:thiaminase II [Endozoicomonas euniceicola]|uniref:Aminopyrimidine aminohydrolase n=1 Tax=Endozoicomonas euniceicola TaxID=1234143 RepID=A0ABY6H134_9GAMM|nr:thiaminase II [Endozoicomonas euniceicola]UYM18753.1 thiaminase II [Endozoicomonas euniceicola]